MNPADFKSHARFLWGGRWHVALARKMGTTADCIERATSQYRNAVDPECVRVLLASMLERRDACALRIWQITPHTISQAA